MTKLKGSPLAILKTIHLLFVVLYSGGLSASLVILVLKVSAGENFNSTGVDIIIYRVNRYLVYYGFFGLTITTILYGLFTGWGIMKHRWIIIKWYLLFALTGIYIGVYSPSINGIFLFPAGVFMLEIEKYCMRA